MSHDDPVAAAHWRARWMKPNAHLWLQQDKSRWFKPPMPEYGAARKAREKAAREHAEREAEADEAFAREAKARRDAEDFECEIRRLRCDQAALRFQVALMRASLASRRAAAVKAGYKPDQPRDEDGKWTETGANGRPRITVTAASSEDGGGGGSGEEGSAGDGIMAGSEDTAFASVGDGGVDGGTDFDPDNGRLRITVTPANIGHNSGPPLKDPPTIPKEERPISREQNRFMWDAARWVAQAVRRGNPALHLFLGTMEAIGWAKQHKDRFQSYQDPPETLDVLRDNVKKRKLDHPDYERGDETHHIVEKRTTSTFSKGRVLSWENEVRIPVYKHWEINRSYGTPNKDLGGVSPREYLDGKSWEEQYRVGIDASIDVGVLKP